MNHYKLLLFLIFLGIAQAHAGDTVCDMKPTYSLRFETAELTTITGNLRLKLWVKSLASQKYRGRITLYPSNFFTVVPITSITDTTHDPNDSFLTEFDLLHNASQLPFFVWKENNNLFDSCEKQFYLCIS